MEVNEAKKELVRVLKSYGFKICDGVPNACGGYLRILDSDREYVFAKTNKQIEDENNKKRDLYVRFSLEAKNSDGKEYVSINFDYATGGSGYRVIENLDQIENLVCSCFIGHRLFEKEELEEMKKKNKKVLEQIDIFDLLMESKKK